MYTGLLHSHSALRYVVMILLIVVILKSLLGWMNKKPFEKLDDRLSLFLLIGTHIQFLVGLLLYFTSPFVQFSGAAMKEFVTRYFTAEHPTMMLVAIALITVARNTQKKLPTPEGRHKRLFILNSIALIIIVVAILYSGRGLFGRH